MREGAGTVTRCCQLDSRGGTETPKSKLLKKERVLKIS